MQFFSIPLVFLGLLAFESVVAAPSLNAPNYRWSLKSRNNDGDGNAYPSDGYASPTGGYATPTDSYSYPTSSCADPTGGYSHPTGGYADPSGEYPQPTGSYDPYRRYRY